MNVLYFQNYYFNPHAIPLLIIGLLILVSGLFVFMKLKDKSIASSFLIMSISGSIWFLGTMMGYFSKNPEIGLFWFKIDNIGVVFLSSTVYAFVASFLNLYKKREPLVFLAYIGSTLIALLTLATNWMDTGVQLFFWGFFPKWGFLSLIFLPFFFLYMLLSFLELIAFLFYGKDPAIKKQILFFILAFAFAYTSSIDYFATYGIPVYPTSFISMGAYFVIIAYAITKTRLMDISVIISKSIAYAITMVVLGIGYLLIVIPYRTYISPNIDFGFVSTSIVYGIFVGFAFERLRMFIQTSSDKVFLKGRYDFKNTMSYFVEILFRAVSMEDLQSLLEKARLEIIESKVLRIVSVNDPQESKAIPREVLNLLSKDRKVETLSDIKHKLKNDADIEQLKDVEFFVPCFSGDSFIAVLLVGKKLSDDPYKTDEIDVFGVLAPQFAKVIERIQPYEKAKIDLVAEQEKVKIAQQAAEENARLATLGTLAAGLAHEIRNPMTVLRSRAERGASHLGDAEFNKESNDLTIKHIDRILNIVNRMLKFARSKEGAFKETNINDSLDEMVSMAENKIKDKSIKIEKDFGQVPSIDCDPDPLLEALLNICINSVESIEKEGRITIKSSLSQMCNVSGNKFPAILIEIEDSGKGISEENIPRIFDPFFTTRHEGTGLGLSIAHRIIAEEHQGIIDVKSSQGKGTKFSIYLPVDR